MAGVEGGSIRDIEDLVRLPFTTKSELRDNFPFGMLAVPRSDTVRVHASSGTGGLGFHYGGERLGATVVPASGGNPGLQVHLMADLGAHGLACTPSIALLLYKSVTSRTLLPGGQEPERAQPHLKRGVPVPSGHLESLNRLDLAACPVRACRSQESLVRHASYSRHSGPP